MADNTENQRSLRPLVRLMPYIARYRYRVWIAVFFLLLAAATTLSLPVAVRRVIDKGFSASDPQLVNSYFAVLIGIAAILGIAPAAIILSSGLGKESLQTSEKMCLPMSPT